MHDLFMVPLLALPELLSSLNQSVNSNDDDALDEIAIWGVTSILGKLALVAVFLKASTFLATHIIRAASYADGNLTSVKGELFTLSVVAYALLVATVSDELSMSIEAGAVLAGIALFKSPYVPKVLSSIQSITSVFGGMYLTSLGMIMSPAFVWREAGPIIELVCLIGFLKFALVSSVLNRFFNYGITPSIAVGSAMAQISEVSLLILAKSQRMGLIRRKTYLLLIPTTCIMLGLAPLSAALLRRLPKLQDSDADEQLPFYLCLLKHLRVLHHPSQSSKKKRAIPLYAARGNNGSVEHYLSHDGNV
jgi:Kef-type K+ transport system membrane component KefB